MLSKLNNEQLKVALADEPRILCLAGAGSGKTYTSIARIVNLINHGVDPHSILMLTFTNAAAFEMQERYLKYKPKDIIEIPTFRTFHSFCYSLLNRDGAILKKLGYSKVPDVADESRAASLFKTAAMQCGISMSEKKLMSNAVLSMKEQADKEIIMKAYRRLLKQKNVITFDILCYDVCQLFVDNSELVTKYKEKYKYIITDEFQDTDKRQFEFVNSFKNSNIMAVGDALQCQPAGTLITMADLSVKPIERIEPGDRVLSYVPGEGRYLKDGVTGPSRYVKRVTAVSTHLATNIVKLSSASHSSCYTKDHITYAKIHYEGNENKYVTYLMSNESGWWRVGSTKLFLSSQGSAFGPRLRLQSEHGNRIWMLGVYTSATEAWVNEQIVAYKYGIPQMTWEHSNVKFSKTEMAYVYEVLGDLTDKATECLSAYGRDILYPMFTRNDLHVHFSKLHLFECRVGNLIPGIFDIVYPEVVDPVNRPHDLHNAYEVLESVSSVDPQIVYGLDIEGTHNYVGDGILTHNCIYSFRGADSSLIKQLADDPNWTTYKLSHNYRSTQNIVKFANDFSKSYAGKSSYRVEMESDKSGPVVNVTRGQYLSRRGQVGYIDDICKTVIRHGLKNDGRVAVLCRTNAEVDTVKKYFAEYGLAVSDGKSSDYYVGVLKASIDDNYCKQLLLSKLNSEELANYIRQSYNQAEFDINTIVTMFKSNSWIIELANNVTELRKIYATCQNWSTMCVAAMSVIKCDDNVPADLSNKIHNVSELVDFIIERLESGVESNLYVGTIHSSKGLEYDTVILPGVNDTAFPLNSEDNLNLYYVGITRAKTNLYIYKW